VDIVAIGDVAEGFQQLVEALGLAGDQFRRRRIVAVRRLVGERPCAAQGSPPDHYPLNGLPPHPAAPTSRQRKY
jgi:hypothetical protein